jgi:hypothetical protein
VAAFGLTCEGDRGEARAVAPPRPQMLSLITLSIEPAMYFGIGFLLAGLMVLPLLGVAHRRAERLTTQRLNMLLPTSVRELAAEKDLLRAEFAVSTQRLAGAVDDLRTKTTAQQSEIGRHGRAVAALKSELGERIKVIAAFETREAALEKKLRATEQEHSLKSINLKDAHQALLDKEAEVARLVADLDTRASIAQRQSFELANARASVAAFEAKAKEHDREVETLKAQLVGRPGDADQARREVADARSNAEDLGRRVADLQLELAAQRNATDTLNKISAERLCEHARLLSVHEHEVDRLRSALDIAQRAEAGLRYELAQIEERRAIESEATLAEKATVEIQIAQLQLDRQQLQWELAATRRDARTASRNPFGAVDDIEVFMRELRTDGGSASPNPAS